MGQHRAAGGKGAVHTPGRLFTWLSLGKRNPLRGSIDAPVVGVVVHVSGLPERKVVAHMLHIHVHIGAVNFAMGTGVDEETTGVELAGDAG